MLLIRSDRLHPLLRIHRRTPNLHHHRTQPGVSLLGRRRLERPSARAPARRPQRNHFLHVPKHFKERLVILE